VIYAAVAYSTALLEILVHANLDRPPSAARYVEAVVPDELAVERLDAAALPGWDGQDLSIPQGFAARWWGERRSAVLLVPSAVTKLDWNAVVNPEHPAAAEITACEESPVIWDRRLFRRAAPA
jgi:RES domain-containing protein